MQFADQEKQECNDDEFCFEIPNMTVLECTMQDDSVTLLPFSKKAISKTDKVDSKDGLYFNINYSSSSLYNSNNSFG